MENYLEAIYDIANRNTDNPDAVNAPHAAVRVTDIAERLSLSKPTVHVAMHSLKDLGLISQEYYGQISLTQKGLDEASKVRQKHNILLAFLTEFLGVDAALAETEACAMEHILSGGTVQKIEELVKGAGR